MYTFKYRKMVNLIILASLSTCFLNALLCWEFNYESGNLSYKVEVLTEQLILGEGPHWDIEGQILYFVDLNEPSVHSYNPATGEHYSAVIKGNKSVSFIIPVEGEKGKFVISHKTDLAIISWDGMNSAEIEPEIVATLLPEENDKSINDGKADPKGRLWTGTMSPTASLIFYPADAVLYSWSAVDGTVTEHVDGIKLSNGLTWSLDNKTMYHIDTLKYTIFVYDYDLQSGTISNERTFFSYSENNMAGAPDGMTIDTKGNLFVASVTGGEILHIDGKSGELIYKLEVPTNMITSLAFGGADLVELYVTSANYDDFLHPKPPDNTTSGRLLRITGIEFQGNPMMNILT